MLASIDAVVSELNAIIARYHELRSPLGYFPALYKRVTIEVQRAIVRRAFDDNARMEQFDIVFAQRYLDAYRQFGDTRSATRSWVAAFTQADNRALTVLQHLLLGMNAHISLDLGIAAASVAGSDPLSLKRDFYAINAILGSQIDDTQRRLSRIFGPLFLVDRLLGSIDENLSLFSIEYARDKAWTQTLELCVADEASRGQIIDRRDQAVSDFASCISRPRRLMIRLLLTLIRPLERGDVASRIRLLDAVAESADDHHT